MSRGWKYQFLSGLKSAPLKSLRFLIFTFLYISQTANNCSRRHKERMILINFPLQNRTHTGVFQREMC